MARSPIRGRRWDRLSTEHPRHGPSRSILGLGPIRFRSKSEWSFASSLVSRSRQSFGNSCSGSTAGILELPDQCDQLMQGYAKKTDDPHPYRKLQPPTVPLFRTGLWRSTGPCDRLLKSGRGSDRLFFDNLFFPGLCLQGCFRHAFVSRGQRARRMLLRFWRFTVAKTAPFPRLWLGSRFSGDLREIGCAFSRQ